MTLVSFCRKTHDLVLFKVETKGVCKKSGLASEALSRVQKQLEQNSQFLQIPYKNSVIHTLIFYWHFLTQITELLPQFWP